MQLLPDYDLQYDPPMFSKDKKIHMELNVTSIVLNLRASFFWEPTFSNRTKSIFINWAQHHKTDAVKVIVAGKRLKFIASPKGEANNRIRRKKSHVTLSVCVSVCNAS